MNCCVLFQNHYLLLKNYTKRNLSNFFAIPATIRLRKLLLFTSQRMQFREVHVDIKNPKLGKEKSVPAVC